MKKLLYMLSLLLLMANCTPKHTSQPQTSAADRQALTLRDSLLDTTELRHWITVFQKQGENHAALIMREKYGELLCFQNQMSGSISQLDTCILEAISLRDTLLWVKALNHQGRNLQRMNALSEASDVLLAANALITQYSRQNRNALDEYSKANCGLGTIELVRGEYDKAENFIRQALTAVRKMKNGDATAVNMAYLGAVLCAQGKKDSASYYIRKSLEYCKRKNFPNGLCLSYKYLGQLYYDTGESGKSIDCYKKSCHYALASHDLWSCKEPLEWLCYQYQNDGQLDSALKYINEDILICQKIGSKNDEGYAMEIRAGIYEKLGEYRQSLQDLHRSSELYSQSHYYESLNHINNVRIGYEKQAQEVEDNQDNLKTQYKEKLHLIHTTFLSALLVAIGIALFFALHLVRLRNRAMRIQQLYNQQLIQDNETLKQQVRKVELANMTASTEDKRKNNFLNTLNDLIILHIHESDLNSNTLAPMMHISPSSLAKRIKEITGMNARAYVLLIRLEKAKKLLRQTDLPMSDIQVQCGFETQSHFSRSFAEQVGMPPSKYRKTVKNKEEA